MKTSILSLLLIALLGITISASIAQQNQNTPKTDTEVEKLKIQLQTVENEKMEIETKLAEANAKLINADIDKLKLELKDSNQQWLWGWTAFLGVIFAVFGVALWLVVRSLIADRVEKSLNGFKDAVDKVEILEDQFRVLRIEHAASLLESYIGGVLIELEWHAERIKALTEEVLLEVFDAKTRDMAIRFAAIEVLAARKSPLLVSPVLNFLNSIVDTEINWGASPDASRLHFLFLDRLRRITNEETYQGLKTFLTRLIEENPKNKNLFLPWTINSLTDVGLKLDMGDSVDMLKKVIPDLKNLEQNSTMLERLAEYFDKFKEPDGIKDIYHIHTKGKIPELEDKCLELLEKHDPEFIKKERKEKEATNTESEQPQ